ncbi:MAG: hypothetical protein WCL39_07295 [Armatimonadota bacterium]
MESEKDLLGFNRTKAEPRRQAKVRVVRVGASHHLVRLAWTVLIVLAAVFIGFPYAIRPHCEAWLLSRDMPSLERRKMRSDEKRAALDTELQFAQSDKGSESLARDYGFIKPGEIPFNVPGQDKMNQKFDLPDRERLTLWDRIMFGLCWISGAGSETVKAEDRQASF